MWYQGYAQAPPVVAAALRSWQRFNSGWRIVALDRHSIDDWIDLKSVIDVDRPDLTLQKLSVIARLCLLRRYGGVWVDATTYCCRPLDGWLPSVYGSGFFAFRDPGPDRLASNWMLAAEPDNPILIAIHDAFLQLWRTTSFTNQDSRLGQWAVTKLSLILNKDARRTTWWTTPLLLKMLRAYPYFIFHYTFNRILLSNPDLLQLWNESKPMNARLPHLLQDLADDPNGRIRAVVEIAQDRLTVQKLDWRLDTANSYWRTVLAALDRRLPVQG